MILNVHISSAHHACLSLIGAWRAAAAYCILFLCQLANPAGDAHRAFLAGTADSNGHAHVEATAAAEAKPGIKPKSSEEWVELLVQQMAGAKDLHDARSRASQVLQAFEQAVLQQASQVCTFTQSLACNSMSTFRCCRLLLQYQARGPPCISSPCCSALMCNCS